MPRAPGLDHQKTQNYIPLISNEFNQPLLNTMANLEKWYFHEGRVVSLNFENMSHIRAKFKSIGFDCLLDIHEQIVPRFVLEFYCQLTFTYNPEGQFVVNFVIQNKSFSLTLEEFSQILKIPFKGQASNTEMWSLDHLSVSVPSRGLYKTRPPSPRAIKTLVQVPRQGQETRTKNKKTIVVGENKILTREIQTHMKPWVDIICENAICLGGHRDHVSAYFLYTFLHETYTPYTYAFFILKRMEKTRFKPKELLPYGMLLTRLFKHVVSVSPELAFDHYLSLIEPCILSLLITSERHERIGARKDLVNQMLAPPPPLKIILPHLIHLITWLKKMMMNHFTPIPLLLLKKSLLHLMLLLESVKTLLMKVMT
ncbi:hypothetical protein Tco_0898326 [Tanacetum coccineum]